MFWKDTIRLGSLPSMSKIILTLFLILAGIGYLLGFLNIFLTYNLVDGEPGLSVTDVRMSYYGSRNKTALEKAIDGSMKQYFASDSEYTSVKDWVSDGASENDWDSTILPIFDSSCNTCHSSAAAIAGVVMETYSDVEGYLGQDSGKSWSRIVSVSHTHVLGTIPVIFLLVLILSFSSYPAMLKNLVSIFAFAAVFIDIGSWSLAKLAPGFAVLVILGGISLGISFGLLVVLPLYDLWIKKQ